MRWTSWALLALLSTITSQVSAGEPNPVSTRPTEPPGPRLVLSNLFAFRENPLGIEDQLRIGVQQRLYRSESTVLRDNFFFGGLAPRVNPAFLKLGPALEIQPLSIFNLRLGAEWVGFYGSFGFLQSFRSPREEYSDTVLRAGKEAGQNYASYGAHAMIEPSVQFKLGPVALRDKVSVEYWKMKVHEGTRVFYDITLDTLISADGWVISNDLDLLYLHDFKSWTGTFEGARLTAGVRYTMVNPVYRERAFPGGDAGEGAHNAHHRVGPLVAFTFFDHGFTTFNKPTALLIANWYADHRYRTGRDVSQAIPYLVLAFAFQSNLLP
jgi:hypothetical protein